jgi:hypothetical protein
MKHSIVIASVCLPIVLTGCATERIADYAPPTATHEYIAQQSGVEVAVDPFVEPVRTEEYFGMNAVANGIAILHVRVVNKTADQTFLIEKKDFQLLSGDPGDLRAVGSEFEHAEKAGGALEASGFVSLNPLLMLPGAAIVSRSSEIQRNFTGKEMGDQTLSPGQSMEGFIYFKLAKKGEDWTRAASVGITLTETKTQQPIQLNVPLSD